MFILPFFAWRHLRMTTNMNTIWGSKFPLKYEKGNSLHKYATNRHKLRFCIHNEREEQLSCLSWVKPEQCAWRKMFSKYFFFLHEPYVSLPCAWWKRHFFHDFWMFSIVFDHANSCASMRLLVEIHNTLPNLHLFSVETPKTHSTTLGVKLPIMLCVWLLKILWCNSRLTFISMSTQII